VGGVMIKKQALKMKTQFKKTLSIRAGYLFLHQDFFLFLFLPKQTFFIDTRVFSLLLGFFQLSCPLHTYVIAQSKKYFPTNKVKEE
jgi:hypothetical protein